MYMYGRPLENIQHLYVFLGSFFEARLFGVVREDEERDYHHTLINDFSAQGGDKKSCSVGEDNSNMCKDVVIEPELMQSQVEKIT
jgi:hypothetical protein